MKIAIIGAAGHYHLAQEGMRRAPDIRLVGIAPGAADEDISPLATVFPGAATFSDYRAMLDAAKPDLAVVNPIFARAARISADCLARGIHVYSEKPLATTHADLHALTDAWRASHRALGGMFNYRYAPWFIAAREAVASGEIGVIRMAHAQKSYRLGIRPDFYRDRARMGGIIPWVAIHAIDWARAFLGDCAWVSAAHSARHNRDHGDLEVSAAMLLGMEDGAIATVTADFLRPEGSARHDDDRLRLTGTRGMLEIIDGVVTLENERAKRTLPLPAAESAFLAFARAASEGSAEQFAVDALAATRVALCARDSADAQGTRIALS
ncbi:MAG: Gfo/Idh/MocA family protein [Christensenellales bacterium]|jgi:predicted dehydrogenase